MYCVAGDQLPADQLSGLFSGLCFGHGRLGSELNFWPGGIPRKARSDAGARFRLGTDDGPSAWPTISSCFSAHDDDEDASKTIFVVSGKSLGGGEAAEDAFVGRSRKKLPVLSPYNLFSSY